MDLDPVVVIGASQAGLNAAQTLRHEGFDGRLVVVDADATTPYDRPPLSKQVLAGAWEPDRITLPAATADLDIDWHLGRRASRLDVAGRTLHLDGDEPLAFGGLVLATGATPRLLPGLEPGGGVHVLRTLDDCLGLRADLEREPGRVVVVGAGFIGAEVAATCRERGLEVTVLEAAAVPLERALGPRMGEVCAAIQRDHGVDLRLGTGVAGLRRSGDGRVTAVELADGSTVDADVVVVGVGVTPAVSWLAGAGLALDDGVVCDETLLAAPRVVAAGDVARWPSRRFGRSLRVEHWENAIQMGEAAGRRLLAGSGPAETYDPIPWFWSDQFDRKIQLAGHSSATDRVEVVEGSTDERRFVALYGRDGRVVGVLGVNRPRHVIQLRRLVDERTPWDEGLAAARDLA